MLSQPALGVPALLLVTAQDPGSWHVPDGLLGVQADPVQLGGGGARGDTARILELTEVGRLLLNLLIMGYGQVMCLKSVCTHINRYFFNRTSPMKTMSHSLEMTWSLDCFDSKVSKVLIVVLGQPMFISRRLWLEVRPVSFGNKGSTFYTISF